MQEMPYRVFTDPDREQGPFQRWFPIRRTELGRVILDFLIMGSYSFLLLRCHALIQHQDANLLAVAIAYVAIYGLYSLWGVLLRRPYPAKGEPLRVGLPLTAMAVAAVLVILYSFGHPNHWTSSQRAFNIYFLVAELLLVLGFRKLNWRQQLRLYPAPIDKNYPVEPEVAQELGRVGDGLTKSIEAIGEARNKLLQMSVNPPGA